MKPVVIDKKCGASESICTAIKSCPFGAISYAETNIPILDREVNCNTSPSADSDCGCTCDCNRDSSDCGGSPYGRIIIDYDKCTECGVCADKCCGNAIEMVA
jgi:ferredoxin